MAVFAALDLSRPADRRTHLGRLVEAVADQGVGALETVVTRKLGANFGVITSSVWTAMVPIALGFIVYLLWRAPGHVRVVRENISESLAGLAVVGFLGFAFNDSGIAVPGRDARRRERVARLPAGAESGARGACVRRTLLAGLDRAADRGDRGGAARPPRAPRPCRRAAAVVVFSVPGLTWKDLEAPELANLRALLDRERDRQRRHPCDLGGLRAG